MKDFFDENVIDWRTIDDYQNEGTLAGLCMGLAESDKLLNYILTQQHYLGKNVYEKIHEAKGRFSDLKNLARALEVKESIFVEYDQEVSKEDIKMALKYYREAILDLTENKKPDSGAFERISSWINYNFIFHSGRFRKVVISFLVAIFLLIILDVTHPGQAIVHFLTSLLFKAGNWFLVAGVFVVGIVIIVLGVIIYFEKKNRK